MEQFRFLYPYEKQIYSSLFILAFIYRYTHLVIGSLLLGIGRGLSGFCPGPALVGLESAYLPAEALVITMIFGMEAYEWWAESQANKKASLS